MNKGVANAKADSDTNKVTVIGKVDPAMLREKLEQKTKKKVELLSPAPKKDKKNDDGGGGDKKAEKKPEKKAEDKKPKEVLPLANVRTCPSLFFGSNFYTARLAHVSLEYVESKLHSKLMESN